MNINGKKHNFTLLELLIAIAATVGTPVFIITCIILGIKWLIS